MATRIEMRRDTTANWMTANPVLADGEPSWDSTVKKFKVGDGVTAWSSLPYATKQYDDALTAVGNAYGRDVRAWAPNTSYVAGQAVVNPSGDVVTAVSSFTSTASYVAANWQYVGVPKWRPVTAYTAGQQVVSPNGDVVSAIATFTSGASYSAANWTLSTTFELKGAALQVIEEALPIDRFSPVNPAGGSDNSTALVAWSNALAGTAYPSGARGYLRPGLWRTSSPLPLNSNVVIEGAGDRTRLAAVGSSNLFEWSTTVFGVTLQDMYLECAVAGKAIFGPGNGGGIYDSTLRGLFLIGSTDTSQILNMVGTSQTYINVQIVKSRMQRTAGSSVVPFNIVNSAGAANFNVFDSVRFNGNNNVNTPFCHIESTLVGTYSTDWSFRDVLGEQNPGGLIQGVAAYNWEMDNVTDEDSTVAYAGNIFDFKANSLGLGSRNLVFRNSARRGQSMASGKYDISCDPATSTEVTIINCNPTPTSQNALLNIPSNSVVMNTRGYPSFFQGTGAPAFGAPVGSFYMRQDGGAGSTIYARENVAGTPTWVAK